MINTEALRQINYIIEHDSTSSTYKYVLLKSVINASQKYEHLTTIEKGRANIPLGLIVEQWILDYMPFVFKENSQQHNKSVLDKPITTIYNTIFSLLKLDKAIEWEYEFFTPTRYKFGKVNFSAKEIYTSIFLINNFDSFSISEEHYNIFRYLGQTLYGTSTIMAKWKQKTISLNADQEITKNIK